VVDKGDQPGNYLEASASCMFVYALAKGYRKGYLDNTKLAAAQKGYEGMIDDLITVDAQNAVHLNYICKVGGLGGNPYRDGSYEYYLGEPVVTDDPKGVGAFILACVEIERAEDAVTSLKKMEELEVVVSPNPVNDQLFVNIPNHNSGFTYSVSNSLGEQVSSGFTSPVDMSHLAPGIYYLKINDQERMTVKKIIKQ
jgi:hypothetical protein